MSITNNCMIVNLQIGAWTGQRLDKTASQKVTDEAGAASDAARVNKHLIPKEMLKGIVTAQGAVRTHFYSNTLPWKDNGDRVLSRIRYMPFIERHEALVGDFNRAVQHFIDVDYKQARDRAAFRMGDLFNADDYPRPDQIKGRFYVRLDIDAVTEAGDFRVALDAAHQDAVRADMERAMQERMGRAMQDVWSRLATTLGHFAEKMSGDEIFRNSTVKNLEEIIDLLPGLNILDDPDLESIRQDLKATLGGVDPDMLRRNSKVRSAAATEAQRIMDNMRGFMNAFGAAA